MSLIGIDLGTSGIRVSAFNEDGEELGTASRTLALQRRPGGTAELDGAQILTLSENALLEVVGMSPVQRDPVTAISFSVLGEAVVPVDAEGRALTQVPISMDERGADSAVRTDLTLGAKSIQETTGQPLHGMFSIYKIAGGDDSWRSAKVRQYRTMGEFVACRWGADEFIDFSSAARTGAFDVANLKFSSEITDALGVDPALFPSPVPVGTPVGRLNAPTAARLNLSVDVQLVAGCHDQAASYIGVGGRPAAVSAFSLGSSDCLTVGTTIRPAGFLGTGFASYPLREGAWVTLAGTAAGGWALEWLSGLLGAAEAWQVHALLDAPSADPPPLLVLPYLAGSGTLDNDPDARGAVLGLTLDTSAPQLVRAFMESTGFELAKIVDAFGSLPVGEIRAVGGGAMNHTALQIRADAAGLPLTPAMRNASARGAALIAGVGTGVFESLATVPTPSVGEPVMPQANLQSWYEQLRHAYAQSYTALAPITAATTTPREKF